MKKQLALWLALVLLVSVLAGCSGKGSDTGIPAAAFSTQSVLTLPLKAELNSGDYLTYGGHQFISKKSLSKMADLIVKNNENVTSAEFKNAYGSCWLFSREVTGGVDSWCLYQQDPANIKNSYIFSGMHRELTTQDGAMELLLLHRFAVKGAVSVWLSPFSRISTDSSIRSASTASFGSRGSTGAAAGCADPGTAAAASAAASSAAATFRPSTTRLVCRRAPPGWRHAVMCVPSTEARRDAAAPNTGARR